MAFADTTITNYQGHIRLDRAIQVSSYDRRLNTSSLHFKSPGLQAPGSTNLKSATSILCNESSVFDDQILDGGQRLDVVGYGKSSTIGTIAFQTCRELLQWKVGLP